MASTPTFTADYIDVNGTYYMCIDGDQMRRWKVTNGPTVSTDSRRVVHSYTLPASFDINKTGWRPVQEANP
jgi:hypothetical protein